MTEGKAIEAFKMYLEMAKDDPWIEDAVGWSLHKVWRDAEQDRINKKIKRMRKEKNDAERD